MTPGDAEVSGKAAPIDRARAVPIGFTAGPKFWRKVVADT
jgi:hypothetical protein